MSVRSSSRCPRQPFSPIEPADIRRRSAVGSSPFEFLLLLLLLVAVKSGLCLPSPSNLSRPPLLLPLLLPPFVPTDVDAGRAVWSAAMLDESKEVVVGSAAPSETGT